MFFPANICLVAFRDLIPGKGPKDPSIHWVYQWVYILFLGIKMCPFFSSNKGRFHSQLVSIHGKLIRIQKLSRSKWNTISSLLLIDFRNWNIASFGFCFWNRKPLSRGHGLVTFKALLSAPAPKSPLDAAGGCTPGKSPCRCLCPGEISKERVDEEWCLVALKLSV